MRAIKDRYPNKKSCHQKNFLSYISYIPGFRFIIPETTKISLKKGYSVNVSKK